MNPEDHKPEFEQGFDALLAGTEEHAELTTRSHQVAFLTAVAIHGTITKAALEAGIHRSTHYLWLEKDEVYAQAFKDAEGMFADYVREEVRRRAIDGIDEPLTYMGRISYHRNLDGNDDLDRPVVIRRVSDRLLELLAKAKCPEFRDKHELTGEGGGPI